MTHLSLRVTELGLRSTQCHHRRQVSVYRNHCFVGGHRETPLTAVVGRHKLLLQPINTYPEPETEKERSPVDFPQVMVSTCAVLLGHGQGIVSD